MVFHLAISFGGLVVVKYKQVDDCWFGGIENVPNYANMSLYVLIEAA